MDIFSKRPLCVIVAVFVVIVALLLFLPVWVKAVLVTASAVLAAVLLWRVKRFNTVIGISLAVVLACIVSYIYFDLYVAQAQAFFGVSDELNVEILDVSYSAPYVTYADVKVHKIGGEKVNYYAKLECSYELEAERGDIYQLGGTFTDFEDDTVFNSKRYYNSKGYYLNIVAEDADIAYIGKAGRTLSTFFRSVNEFCESRLQMILDEEAFGFTNAIFLGNRENIDPALKRDFTELGISHMIAISGMHLTVLIGGIYDLLRRIGIHRKIIIGITVGICVFYVGMTGATPAILRAGIMYIIMSVSALVLRENDSITSLFVTAGLIILFTPNAIFDAAFLLSCFSTLGILIVSPRISDFMYAAGKRGRILSVLAGIPSGIAITVAATLFTLPLTAYYFGRFSILLPLTNIIFELPTTLLLMLSPFAVLFSYIPLLGDFTAWLCEITTAVMTVLSRAIAALDIGSVSLRYPFVPVILILFIAAVLLLMFFKVKNPFWLLAPLAIVIVAYTAARGVFLYGFDSYDYVDCMNSARNDMVLVHSNGETAVIDISYGGRTSAQTAIVTAGNEFYDNRIDAYILTHYHNYHPATIDKITDMYYIDTVYAPLSSDPDDIAVAEAIAAACDGNGVDFVFYDEGVILSENAEITLDTSFVKRSVHPVITLDIELHGSEVSYCSPAVLELPDTASLSPTVFFGAHGPKVKPVIESFESSVVVYSNGDICDQYNVSGDEEYILTESGGYKILRIAHSE